MDDGVALGIDIGGTKVALVLVDRRGTVIAERRIANRELAAARAEATFGAGTPYPTFGYVTIGTGISSTFVRDGAPWEGAHGTAQLLGSAQLALPCPHCGRMLEICLEDVASGAGIVRRYRERSSAEVRGA